jgi:purine nucleosidase
MAKKIILDLDTGIDDTLAMSYVLGSPDAELIGVTGTYGNVVLEQGVSNDLRLLKMFHREDVPVFKGIPFPTGKNSFKPEWSVYHGENGTGNVEIPAQTDRQPSEIPAVDFIIDAVRKYGDDLVVVPTGASTTIAAVLEKAPDIVNKIHIVLMGGSLTQPGNCNPWQEANMGQDPIASNAMFASAADITMVGLDVTVQAHMSRDDTAKLRATGTVSGKFLADMTDYYIGVSEQDETNAPGICYLHDPLAAAVALDPSLVKTFPINIQVETEGPSVGRTIGDPVRLASPVKNTKVALSLDAERFTADFMSRLMRLVKTVG